MNHYKLSSGQRISKSLIDQKVKEAKKEKLQQQFDELGYNVCEECWKNDDKPIDVSHIVSVDECQKSANVELAWDLINLRILGRKCHRIWDKTYIYNGKKS
jgi:5-methylcytosine-specific restriction endonuclease McrA